MQVTLFNMIFQVRSRARESKLYHSPAEVEVTHRVHFGLKDSHGLERLRKTFDPLFYVGDISTGNSVKVLLLKQWYLKALLVKVLMLVRICGNLLKRLLASL